MNDYFTRFNESPVAFKKCFGLLITAWISHLLFIYSLFWGQGAISEAYGDIKKMAAVSLSLCVFLFLMKKWARALVVMGSFFIVIYDLMWFATAPRNPISTILCVLVVLCTVMGTYFLFTKDTRHYFTRINPKPEPPETFTKGN